MKKAQTATNTMDEMIKGVASNSGSMKYKNTVKPESAKHIGTITKSDFNCLLTVTRPNLLIHDIMISCVPAAFSFCSAANEDKSEPHRFVMKFGFIQSSPFRAPALPAGAGNRT